MGEDLYNDLWFFNSFHTIFLDGCYRLDQTNKPEKFISTTPPSKAELDKILKNIISRLIKALTKKGVIFNEQKTHDEELNNEPLDDDPFTRAQASSVSYCFAFGPSKGKKAITLNSMKQSSKTDPFVANISGFSLHAGVATNSDQRDKLERLCRYITRPAIAESRLSINGQGNVVYQFKKVWSNGTTTITMLPLEFMEKLVALTPRPKIHLTRFYGVLVSHYKYRKDIVPKPTPPAPPALEGTTEQLPSDVKQNLDPAPLTRSKRYSWARLLKRVFQIDVSKCTNCGGNTKIIASIEKPEVIEKILSHLKLPTKPPPLYPARGPPTGQNESDDYTQLFPRDEPQELYSGLFHHFPQEFDQLFYQDQE